MDPLRLFCAILVFIFSIFFYPALDSAIDGIGGGVALKVVLNSVPAILLGAIIITVFYWSFKE